MNKEQPVMNKICNSKNWSRDMQLHKESLVKIQPIVDKNEPKTYHLMNKAKVKTAQEGSRTNEVERENRILLEKITHIMKNGSNLKRSATISNITGQVFTKKSLNIETRKKDLVKTVIENQAILKRIQEKKSAYNVRKWDKDREQTEKYISNICDYQYKDFKPTKTQVRIGDWNDTASYTPKKNLSRQQLEPLLNERQSKTTKATRNLYNKSRKVGLDYYFIQINVNKGLFIISLDNIEKADQKYTIQLQNQEASQILKQECQDNYDTLIDRIRIDERNKSIFFKRLDNQQSQHLNVQGNASKVLQGEQQQSSQKAKEKDDSLKITKQVNSSKQNQQLQQDTTAQTQTQTKSQTQITNENQNVSTLQNQQAQQQNQTNEYEENFEESIKYKEEEKQNQVQQENFEKQQIIENQDVKQSGNKNSSNQQQNKIEEEKEKEKSLQQSQHHSVLQQQQQNQKEVEETAQENNNNQENQQQELIQQEEPVRIQQPLLQSQVEQQQDQQIQQEEQLNNEQQPKEEEQEKKDEGVTLNAQQDV